MNAEKMMRFKKQEILEETRSENHVYKDVRVWLAAILAITLLYITAANYPVLW